MRPLLLFLSVAVWTGALTGCSTDEPSAEDPSNAAPPTAVPLASAHRSALSEASDPPTTLGPSTHPAPSAAPVGSRGALGSASSAGSASPVGFTARVRSGGAAAGSAAPVGSGAPARSGGPAGSAALDALAAPADASCGAQPESRCALRDWMKAHMAPAIVGKDFDALRVALDAAATLAPASYPNWASIARDGADAARTQDLGAVKAACRSCHGQYRDRYRRELRDRPL